MSTRGKRLLWALIAVGTAIRVILAFATVGIAFDIDNYAVVAQRLSEADPLQLYGDVNTDVLRWPYASGYFPWVLFADGVATHSALPFHGVIQLAPVMADAALAWVVQAFMGDRGASERTRLLAAGLVALGPSFALVSGYEGQHDSVAILPAVIALLLWQRWPPGRRAMAAGVLIGVGAAIKTVPLLMILPLLPSVRDRREAATLITWALAVPAISIAPWLLADRSATMDALQYNGLPGLGGLSLVAQPSLLKYWLLQGGVELSSLSNTLYDARSAITGVVLGATAVLLLRRRPQPATGAVIVWLAVFAFGLNFGPRYLIWALPFILMAGHLRAAGLLQAVCFPAAVILLGRPYDSDAVALLYFALMLILLVAFFAWLAALVLRPGGQGAGRARSA